MITLGSIPLIQKGGATLVYGSTSRLTVDVTFDTPFPSTPTVTAVLAYRSGDASMTTIGTLYVQNESPTGFNAQVTNAYGYNFAAGNTIHLNWSAEL